MKKLIAIILALACVLSLCACGGAGAYTDSDKDGYVTAEGKTKFTIGIIPNAMILDLNNNDLTKWIEEECNVELEFMPFAGGTDVPTQISAAIAARQELPDICIGVELDEAALNRYGREGYIVDLQDYFADKEGKSKIFWDRVENELTEWEYGYVTRKMVDQDTDGIYAVPSLETSLVDMIVSMAWINQEWLDKLGLQKPTNCDELVEVLRAFKTKDPNGNGKQDEIPLYGGTSGLGSNVFSWLMNMFIYFNNQYHHNATEDGQIYMVYTQDGYREGLKFIHDLYAEGLLTNLMFSSTEQGILTPTNGTALCGIFISHLSNCQNGNELIYQYEPLGTWGYGLKDRLRFQMSNFITENCAEGKRDKAFEVMMKLWSWEGSQRQRYGAYGVHWTDAEEGAKSVYGLDAEYKLLSEVLGTQNASIWRSMCSFNNMAECETAQIDEMEPFAKKRAEMHAAAYKLFKEAEDRVPDYVLTPTLLGTDEQKEAVEAQQGNVYTYMNRMQTDFITGANDADIHSDKQWNAYLAELEKLGVNDIRDYYQTLYDALDNKIEKR